MVKAVPVSANDGGARMYLDNAQGEVLHYRQAFDLLGTEVPFSEAAVVSSLPRGGLQVVQPPRLSESFVRSYSRELYRHDRVTWQSIRSGESRRSSQAWDDDKQLSEPFFAQWLRPNGFEFVAVAPLVHPVLSGYAGAVHLYRTAAQGDFTDAELRALTEFAGALDSAIQRVRQARQAKGCPQEPVSKELTMRQFVLDSQLRPVFPENGDLSALDNRLRASMLDDARLRLQHVNGEAVTADRVPLPDVRGDLWNFRVVTHRSYPALSAGPVVFYCLQPECCDWRALRPTDFQADSEISRLIPALHFMSEQFHRGPTLVEIAKTVHLSPFHFHRRFTDLLGITPKHFLLDCQIQQAKAELLSQQKELVTIATECGFAHQSHFTSRFKQATGLTPTRWRRMAIEAKRASATPQSGR